MKAGRRIIRRLAAVIAAAVMTLPLLSGCGETTAKEDTDTITVYLWSAMLYDSFAPYIQSKLPGVNIEFVVGNNDLDFYKFMSEHGELPDIITTRRFSLHDAVGLKDQLMDLSATDEAAAIYGSYLESFANPDGTVNWLPLCGTVDGIVANRAVFDKYGIPLPTDYDSMVSACQAFEEKGIRGFVADFAYDYTCMEVLQGRSIPELTSMEGRMWRSAYADPFEGVWGLDEEVWPGAFQRMEQFIKDVDIQPEDLELDYAPVIDMFTEGKAAMIRSGGTNVVEFQENNVDAVFLPYFGQNGEQWLLTYPEFQVALNKNLEKDSSRREKALQVLGTMFSEEGENVLGKGQDIVAYSQNVDLALSPHLDNLKPLIQENRMYIRIASNDFFEVSKDVVSKMIRGEYDAGQAYEAFDTQLKQSEDASEPTILSLDRGYSNIFHREGGNESYSAMANTLRTCYGSDVLIAPAYSFTGTVIQADYTQKMVSSMIMPNSLIAWQCEMKGSQLKEYIRASVEGIENGFTPFNRGSLPTVSGISMEVKEVDGTYTLSQVLKDGKEISDEDTFKVTCLNTLEYMESFLSNENLVFEEMENGVRDEWTAYIMDGGRVEEPEPYIALK